jgi:hypothetical protein
VHSATPLFCQQLAALMEQRPALIDDCFALLGVLSSRCEIDILLQHSLRWPSHLRVPPHAFPMSTVTLSSAGSGLLAHLRACLIADRCVKRLLAPCHSIRLVQTDHKNKRHLWRYDATYIQHLSRRFDIDLHSNSL